MTKEFDPSRRNVLKNILTGMALSAVKPSFATELIEKATKPNTLENPGDKTTLTSSGERFQNGTEVFNVNFKEEGGESRKIGELWPVSLMNFVTKESNPELFDLGMEEFMKQSKAVASAPDGMTKALNGYVLEGRAIAHGVVVNSDGSIPKYGIVVLDKKGRITKLTHALELVQYNADGSIKDKSEFEKLYTEVKDAEGSLFFLPSVMRTYQGQVKKLESDKFLEQILVKRFEPAVDPKGNRIPGADPVETFKVIRFDPMITYKQAIRIVEGMERENSDGTKAFSTHIYMLDGGNDWDRSAKVISKDGGRTYRTEVLSEGKKEVATAAIILY